MSDATRNTDNKRDKCTPVPASTWHMGVGVVHELGTIVASPQMLRYMVKVAADGGGSQPAMSCAGTVTLALLRSYEYELPELGSLRTKGLLWETASSAPEHGTLT